MKIIDLLNKIANGEPIPKYIKYMNYITNESDTMMVCKENIVYALDQLKTHLNDEVEIIEDTPKEEKKIPEKLPEFIHSDSLNYMTCNRMFETLTNKYNEIIDYLKSKGDE